MLAVRFGSVKEKIMAQKKKTKRRNWVAEMMIHVTKNQPFQSDKKYDRKKEKEVKNDPENGFEPK